MSAITFIEKENVLAWAAVGTFVGGTVLLYTLEKSGCVPQAAKNMVSSKGRIPLWSFVVLFAAYLLLIPGMLRNIFHYKVTAVGTITLQETSETILGYAMALAKIGSWEAPLLICTYALVIPAIKLFVVYLVQVLPEGSKLDKAVLFLHNVSKWASPDMFAYMMILFLVRGLDHPPILAARGSLDLGFSCFSVFCVFSTIATLGIHRKETQKREVTADEPVAWLESRRMVLFVVGLLCTIFSVALGFGLVAPSMALRLDVDKLYAPSGPVDLVLKPVVDTMGLPELMANDVSVAACIKEMAKWAAKGEANGFIGVFLFAIFGVGLAVLDMILLLIASVQMCFTESKPGILRLSQAVKKCSMLDVAITGIVLVVFCGSIYRKQGLCLSLHRGIVLLLVAELCHYTAYYLVMATADTATRVAAKAEPDLELGDRQTSDIETAASNDDLSNDDRKDSEWSTTVSTEAPDDSDSRGPESDGMVIESI